MTVAVKDAEAAMSEDSDPAEIETRYPSRRSVSPLFSTATKRRDAASTLSRQKPQPRPIRFCCVT